MSEAKTYDWLAGGGEMGRLVRAHDWSRSPLGPPSTWPQSLKTALSICLGSKFPMVIWWGRDLCVFYNDAYIPITGPLKHPMFLGRPAQEQWPEIWDVVGAQAKHVLATGEATWSEDQPLFMTRSGFVEECYFTFSFSPAREESGAVGGMFCAVQEMTARVIGERRLRVLRELGAEAPETVERVAASAAQIIGKSANDAPFVLVYLTGTTGATAALAGAAGVASASSIAPEVIALTPSAAHWPLARVNETRRAERVDGLRGRFPGDLPKFPYEELPDSAWVIPIELAGHGTPFGFVVLGINPRLEFDDTYQGFFSLVCKQITSHVFNVRALAEEKKRTEALAEMDRAKTAFFSNVSHEFRTPLTLMLGPIEQMLEGSKGELTPALRAETEVVQRNALRLLKLVNALLDFSRIEAGRVEALYEPTDLSVATTDLASGFRAAIEQAGYVRRLLQQRYDVSVAHDGQEALEVTRRERPDLVISDIMMPVMDGIAFLKALRGDQALQTTPVILLSARAGEEARASGIETGADDYLTKPFSAKELLARVQTQLLMAEVRRSAAEKDVVVAHLAQRQRWLESVLDLVPTPLLLMEPDTGRMKFANQAAHRMAGGRFPMDVPLADYDTTFTITTEEGTVLPSQDVPAARASRGEFGTRRWCGAPRPEPSRCSSTRRECPRSKAPTRVSSCVSGT